jgi:hypothetical protein
MYDDDPALDMMVACILSAGIEFALRNPPMTESELIEHVKREIARWKDDDFTNKNEPESIA